MLKSGIQLLVLYLYFVKMKNYEGENNSGELDIGGNIIFKLILK